MRSIILFTKIGIFLLIASALSAAAQKPGSLVPRQEKLLNGLKVLMWNDPAADKVSVRIRVHSGSAFDQQGKEGTIRLLADNIFPNEAARDFFKDDLGGDLQVTSNYDFIQIDASSKPSEFLAMLETLAQAVSNPTIDKETTETLKKALAAEIAEREQDPAHIADQAAAKRLFGTFPYGRPQIGTLESVARIDFADILFAKERLFGADNATITVSGNYNGDLAYRAIRRYFGSWLKSDNKVPPTFKQPDEPDTKILEGEVDGLTATEVRFMLRGLAKNDKDYAAAEVLANILNERLRSLAKGGRGHRVEHNAHVLPGAFVFGYSADGRPAVPAFSVFADKFTEAEFVKAKTVAVAENASRSLQDVWLDVDTYRLSSAAEAAKAFEAVTLADVQRVADRLSKNPVVTVVVGGPEAAE